LFELLQEGWQGPTAAAMSIPFAQGVSKGQRFTLRATGEPLVGKPQPLVDPLQGPTPRPQSPRLLSAPVGLVPVPAAPLG